MPKHAEIRCYNCGRLLLKCVPADNRRGVILLNSGKFDVKEAIERPLSVHLVGKFELKCGRCKAINVIASKIITKDLDLAKISSGKIENSHQLLELLIKNSYLVNLSASEHQKRSEAIDKLE